MYESLEIFRTSAAMARHAGARQLVVAQNLANADTPGYRAMALPGFGQAYRDSAGVALRGTRAGHLGAQDAHQTPAAVRTDAEPSPNGNSVSVELEMLSGVEAQREHSRALAIWRHGLTVIRASLGR
jgi:flagellar basal-body rod protein FlgB